MQFKSIITNYYFPIMPNVGLLCVDSMYSDSLSQRLSSLLVFLQRLGRLPADNLVVAVHWTRLSWLARVPVGIPESEWPQVQLAPDAKLRGI